MLVDACTYIFNGCAIRRTRLRGREDKWAVLGPVVSTAVLVGAMIYIMIDAIHTLVANENGDVDEVVVLAFGLANLAVDIFAAVLFLAYPDAYVRGADAGLRRIAATPSRQGRRHEVAAAPRP